MSYKKLSLAISVCILAAAYTYLKTANQTSKLSISENRKTENKNTKKIEKTLINEPILEVIHSKKELKKAVTTDKKITNNSQDPYKELLLKIENNEVQYSDEEKLESLKSYLDTTISAAALEQTSQEESNTFNENISANQRQRSEESNTYEADATSEAEYQQNTNQIDSTLQGREE